MERLRIFGGQKLFGELSVPCAKNAYLPILAASVLCEGRVILHKNPHFVDIYNMCAILEDLGSVIKFMGDDIIIDNSNLTCYEISQEKASTVRSSIFSLGSILGRFKKAKVAFPGGCEIGARPIDIHLKGLKNLNVKINDKHGYLICNGENMKGADFHLDFPSVGATENLMLASVLINGETNIYNCAKEPEIIDLANFLVQLGAKIEGAGTSHIHVTGVKILKREIEYTPITDRIIAGTYALAVASCGGEVSFLGMPKEYLGSLFSKLQNTYCKIGANNGRIVISSKGKMKAFSKIETMPYPGFPTDLQAQLMATLATARGTSIIVENLFEGRFKQVPELVKMGAKITLHDKVAVIDGVEKLYGASVCVHDLRGGAALVLAGLRAEGYTTLDSVSLIDRGYYQIEKELSKLGAKIQREKV